MKLVLMGVALLLACGRAPEPRPDPATPASGSAPPGGVPADATARQRMARPTDAAVDAAAVASADASTPDAPTATSAQSAPRDAGAVELVPGRGKCVADSDCVLTQYQQGCCTQACAPRAISKKVIAALQKGRGLRRVSREREAVSAARTVPPCAVSRAVGAMREQDVHDRARTSSVTAAGS